MTRYYTIEGQRVKWLDAGCYGVYLPRNAEARRNVWVPIGATTLKDAEAVIKESGIERLVLLYRADALTSQTIALATCGKLFTCREVFEAWDKDANEIFSPGTANAYRAQLQAFIRRGGHGRTPISKMGRPTIDHFVNAGGSLSTRRVRMAAIRSLWQFARARNLTVHDVPSMVRIKHADMTIAELEKRPVFPITEEEYRTIMAKPGLALFWRVSVALSYWTGLRFVDCCCLEWDSLKPDLIIVWTKKRSKRVALPLDDPLIGSGELRAILGELQAGPRTDPTYCFPYQRDQYRTGCRHYLPTRFAVILRQLGIEMKSFHSLRHAAASRWFVAGKSLEEIGRHLGHSDTKTTEGYTHKETA
jgi:integrase